MEKPAVVLGASWRYLADKGDAVGAMNAAEQAGFTWLANSMPRGDVLVLGDVARKAKQPAPRDRRPGWRCGSASRARWAPAKPRCAWACSPKSSTTSTGRCAGISSAAREAPNAATAPEALGDWLGRARARRAAPHDAKQVAAEYLKRFKNGPDAAAARAVLAR